jgi:hypothetical protein
MAQALFEIYFTNCKWFLHVFTAALCSMDHNTFFPFSVTPESSKTSLDQASARRAGQEHFRYPAKPPPTAQLYDAALLLFTSIDASFVTSSNCLAKTALCLSIYQHMRGGSVAPNNTLLPTLQRAARAPGT